MLLLSNKKTAPHTFSYFGMEYPVKKEGKKNSFLLVFYVCAGKIFITLTKIHKMTMQSATSRLNTIVMFGGTVLFAIAILNHLHGRMMYNPQPQIDF